LRLVTYSIGIRKCEKNVKTADIATLGRGEFIASFDQEMYGTYVWPAWMRSALHAEAIARGEESLDSAREIVQEFDREQTE
jgi:hypothetical protein